MGGLLAQLSNKQLADAVRAGGYDGEEAATYVRVLRERINQLQNLKSDVRGTYAIAEPEISRKKNFSGR
jgi:hypothetical protein